MQTRDKFHVVSLPRLKSPLLCPYRALKRLFLTYSPSSNQPLFQIQTKTGYRVFIDSTIRKILARLNTKLGYPKDYYTFHTFRHSGASLVYNSHVPIQQIQEHGSWTSDCVWKYIKQDQSLGENIALALANVVDNA